MVEEKYQIFGTAEAANQGQIPPVVHQQDFERQDRLQDRLQQEEQELLDTDETLNVVHVALTCRERLSYIFEGPLNNFKIAK